MICLFKVDVLEKGYEEEYEGFLNECRNSSVQHSLDWAKVVDDLGKDKPYFAVAREKNKIVGALPLYFFKCPLGNLLTTTSWYTISGIVSSEKSFCSDIYRSLLNFATNLGKELDCAAISIGTNPFMGDESLYLENYKSDYTLENFVQYIVLSDVFSKEGIVVHPNYLSRNEFTKNLRTAQRQPITISEEPTEKNLDEWYKIHEKRMNELRATPMPKDLFTSIRSNLVSKNKGKFIFAFCEGQMLSGGVYLFNRKEMDAFMISANSDFRKLRPNYLTTFNLLEWANATGIAIFNWMSSSRRNDGVYLWKKKWGSNERTFLYLTKVLSDISEWKEMDYHELKKAYSFHYLLPFNLLKDSNCRFTTKDQLSSFTQTQT